MQLILQWLPAFLLIFCRISAFFIVAPVFSFRGIPAHFKVGFVFFISLVTLMTIETEYALNWDYHFVISILRELLVGVLLGFIAYMFFTIVQVAGSFVDLQMGFAIANIVDPITGAQSPIIGNLKFFIAILLFLAIDGHHYLIQAIIESYQWVPLYGNLFAQFQEGSITDHLIVSFSKMFLLAFQMAAPLIATLFLIDVGMGILAKTAPQFNLFIVGIPLKILVGFLVLLIMVPGLLYLFQDVFLEMFRSMREMISIMSS